ncbi:unnamed protein product [Trichobilharzia regenti]|nr:unnamed protein product [Trichobilharzia regenti]
MHKSGLNRFIAIASANRSRFAVLFCPSAVSLITIPQNGIQETYGEQILECTATSSHPPAIINWFQHNSSGSVHKTTTENVIMESSLMKVEALPKSNLLITTETVSV